MVTAQSGQNIDAWRILLSASNGSELLVLRRAAGFCLPVLHISPQERIAASLNAEAQRLWNIKTVCVAPLDISHPDRTSDHARYHVMEVRRPEELSRIAPKAMDVAALAENAFADVRDYLAVRRTMKLDAVESSDSQGPFSGFEAFRKIFAWVEQQLQPLERRCDGEFRQLHASDSFALIRFGTNKNAVWFKATGEPNRRELAITQVLADLFPRYTAKLIAVHSDWNAWLSDEIEGTSLDSTRDLESWCGAAKSLAELQVASIGHTATILARRAHDSRIASLRSLVPSFFAAIGGLMEAQVKASPRRLTAQEISATALRLTGALHELEMAAIPDGLNHFDLNPGNAIVCGRECKFVDWAEAAIGNPFFSFEYLSQHFARSVGDGTDFLAEFRKSYVNVWRTVLSPSVIERACELMPLIAPFAFAVTLPWNDAHGNAKSECSGFLRSLARRMHREAEQLILRVG
jgi:hypothetical protein